MTDTTVHEPAREGARVQIDPMAAAGEYAALNEFYKNRCLLLANELAQMRNHAATLEQHLAEVRAELDASKEGK